MSPALHIVLVLGGVFAALILYWRIVVLLAEALFFPTPEAKAAGEQHDTDSFTAPSAVPARRGFHHSPLVGSNLPAGSGCVTGARIERESVCAAKPGRPAAGRENLSGSLPPAPRPSL